MKRALGILIPLFLLNMTIQNSSSAEASRPRIVDVRSERAGVVYFIGEEIGTHWGAPGDPPGFITVEVAHEQKHFRPINAGDRVIFNQLLIVATDKAAERNLNEATAHWREAIAEEMEEVESKQAAIRQLLLAEVFLKGLYPAGSIESDRLRAKWIEISRSQRIVLEKIEKNEATRMSSRRAVAQRFLNAQEALARLQVSSLQGRVTKILVQPGQTVRVGDVIMQIEVDAPESEALR